MNLIFNKDKDGKILVTIDGKDFTTKDYISMIKEIKEGKDIKVSFDGDVSSEEKENINSMISDINNIKEIDKIKIDESDIDPESIPF